MSLGIQVQQHPPTCSLSIWSVINEPNFVAALAWLYVRKPNHAVRISNALEPGLAGLPGKSIENAISLLRYDTDDIVDDLQSSDPGVAEKAQKTLTARMSQRDGLLFQHISWLAASRQFPNAHAVPPHVRKADKGFDGFLLEMEAPGSGISKLVLCEDKASDAPRGLVTGKIWPELDGIHAGDKDLEILDAVTALLQGISEHEREAALTTIVWHRVWSFRVALTAGANQQKAGSYKHLFDGYENHVSGEADLRMAEIMPMVDVRPYLQKLADKVISELEEIKSNV